MTFACNDFDYYDLAIKNVNIFDSESKQILKNKTILIRDDTISAILDSTKTKNAKTIIDGKNKLVTPGFIDTHIHLAHTLGDKENAPEYLEKDSIKIYLQMLADVYLKYGVTTILGAGQPENWLRVSLEWQYNPSPNYPNIYNSGGALISDEERIPNIGHVEIQNPTDALKKVCEYFNLGIRHLKIYWRLRKPEMKAVIDEANKLNMYLCGHVDQNIVSIETALNLGLKNFEHFFTLPIGIFKFNEHYRDFSKKYDLERIDTFEKMLSMRILIFKYIHENPKLKNEFENLLNLLAIKKATVSTTIHLLGSVVGKTYFCTNSGSTILSQLNFNSNQLDNLHNAFEIMMNYLKMAYEKGINIRIGTDCKEGGKAYLSELLLLYEADFSLEDILQIATFNGAEAINLDDRYGSIKVGNKADLIIFEKNPFEDYKNLLYGKIIVKGGKEFSDSKFGKLNN